MQVKIEKRREREEKELESGVAVLSFLFFLSALGEKKGKRRTEGGRTQIESSRVRSSGEEDTEEEEEEEEEAW